MLKPTGKKFSIEPIVQQVQSLGYFEKSIVLNETNGKLLSGPYTTKKEFQNTPLGEVLASIENPGEARLLKLAPSETYSAHADPDDRYHLSIITNPFSYLIDITEEKLYHLPVDGSLWEMNTEHIHIAANFGPKDRIHLVVRIPLPTFSSPGYSIKISGGDVDWKQESYIVIMSFFNRAIKNKVITGFEKVNDREVLINCADLNVLDPFLSELKYKGFEVEVKNV